MILGVFRKNAPRADHPIALNDSDLSDPLVALKSGDGVDLVRDLVRFVLQELVEAEASSAIGATRYERSGERVTERNGHRSKTLATKAGVFDLPPVRRTGWFR